MYSIKTDEKSDHKNILSHIFSEYEKNFENISEKTLL